MEYVIIIAVGAAFATLLYNIFWVMTIKLLRQ